MEVGAQRVGVIRFRNNSNGPQDGSSKGLGAHLALQGLMCRAIPTIFGAGRTENWGQRVMTHRSDAVLLRFAGNEFGMRQRVRRLIPVVAGRARGVRAGRPMI
jgi:hypothetical protein